MTPDGNLTLDEWADCAWLVLEEWQREIETLDQPTQERLLEEVLAQLRELELVP